jgi:tetratricopeptide (TPR) repeat protein
MTFSKVERTTIANSGDYQRGGYFLNEGERAFSVLRADPAQLHDDPWLLSTEIAISEQMGLRSLNLKRARSVLEADVSPRAKTELAAQLATLEVEANNYKRAGRFVKISAIDPTENACAQIEWLERERFLNVPHGVAVPSGEAQAVSAARRLLWDQATEQGELWLKEQPVSSRPGAFASHAAAVGLRAWDRGADLAKMGMVAHPRDPLLINNLAYCLAESGDLVNAAAEISKLRIDQLPVHLRTVVGATRGLLEFRRGNLDAGRALYEEGIRLARQAKNPTLALNAQLMLFREEVFARIPDSAQQVLKVIAEARTHTDQDIRAAAEFVSLSIEDALRPAPTLNLGVTKVLGVATPLIRPKIQISFKNHSGLPLFRDVVDVRTEDGLAERSSNFDLKE